MRPRAGRRRPAVLHRRQARHRTTHEQPVSQRTAAATANTSPTRPSSAHQQQLYICSKLHGSLCLCLYPSLSLSVATAIDRVLDHLCEGMECDLLLSLFRRDRLSLLSRSSFPSLPVPLPPLLERPPLSRPPRPLSLSRLASRRDLDDWPLQAKKPRQRRNTRPAPDTQARQARAARAV